MRSNCGKSGDDKKRKEGRLSKEKEGEECEGEERLKGFLRCDLLVSFPGLDRMSLLSSSGSGLGAATSLGSVTLDGRQIPSADVAAPEL